MPTDNPTWWTVLDSIPAWRPTIFISTSSYGDISVILAQHHDNADLLAKLAVIEGLRHWINRPGERSVEFMATTSGAASALMWGDDADLIAAALAIAAATNPIASHPPSEGHNP